MDGFREGDSRTLQIAITDDIVNAFAEWSGDDAPLHTSDAYARARGFEKKVVHGAALFSLVSRFVGVHFPGPESLWMKADVKFHKPCYTPCEVTIRGEILSVSEATSSIILGVTVLDASQIQLMSVKSFHKILSARDADDLP